MNDIRLPILSLQNFTPQSAGIVRTRRWVDWYVFSLSDVRTGREYRMLVRRLSALFVSACAKDIVNYACVV